MGWMTFTLSLGGIGLMLLGMSMMTDGLKAAAGSSLQGFLERSTKTRLRAALAGFGITALVQSSSAVIVTTLGFTNAGMLRLKQAAWVVFGSNLGTTITAWIVALIGLKINVGAFALPLIGAGMLLKLFGNNRRIAHIGFSIAGFGLLFLSLGMLRDAFIDVADWIPIERLGTSGPIGILLGVLFGALLTALIQSSSAALAIILTASVTGVLTPLLGASLVIGANIGTTSTSLLASIGATPNARRLALVHVTEKLFTGCIALLLLGPLWWLFEHFTAGSDRRMNISTGLALFHTLFNLFGLLLMSLFADQLLRRVEQWIKQPELNSDRLRYLDDTVISVPEMGMNAMHLEIKRVFKQLLFRGREIIDRESQPEESIHTGVLLAAIGDYGNRIGAQNLTEGLSEVFLNLNWAREESLQLRDLIIELAEFTQSDINAALDSQLPEALLVIMRSGELKQLTLQQRSEQLQLIKNLRHKRRTELLELITTGYMIAPDASRLLRIIALFEESSKHILRIAEVIYPEPLAEDQSQRDSSKQPAEALP